MNVSSDDDSDSEMMLKIIQKAAPGVKAHSFTCSASYPDWEAQTRDEKAGYRYGYVSEPSMNSNDSSKSIWRTKPTDRSAGQGIIYQLATNMRTRPYHNPCLTRSRQEGTDTSTPPSEVGTPPQCHVAVSMSTRSKSSAPPESLFSQKVTDAVSTDSKPNSWILITLKNGVHVVPTSYSLTVENKTRPCSWRLEASNDGSAWTLMKHHKDDQGFSPYVVDTATHTASDDDAEGLDGKFAEKRPVAPASDLRRGTWTLREDETAANSSNKLIGYNRFRIMATGTDANGSWGFNGIVGFEVYGVVGGQKLRSLPKPLKTGRFMILQMLTSDKRQRKEVADALNRTVVDTLLLSNQYANSGSDSDTQHILIQQQLCVPEPRVVELEAKPLADFDANFRQFAMEAWYSAMLFSSEDTPTKRLAVAVDEILLRSRNSSSTRNGIQLHLNKEEEEAGESDGGSVPLHSARQLLKGLSDDQLEAVFLSFDKDSINLDEIKDIIFSCEPTSIAAWLQTKGYDLNLCRSQFETFAQARQAFQATTTAHCRCLVRYLLHFARDSGQPSLFDLDASQLLDTGVPGCKQLQPLRTSFATLSTHMASLRLLFLVLKRLSGWFVDLYPFLSQERSMVELIRSSRELIFPVAKTYLIDQILDITAEEKLPKLKVKVDRMAASAWENHHNQHQKQEEGEEERQQQQQQQQQRQD